MSLTGTWPSMALPGAPEANPHLYVHNVPKDSNEEELRSVFGQFGQVANVRLKVNQKVGPHAVYAFVTFASTEEAHNALVNLQGKELRGRSLRIEFQRAASGAQQPQRIYNAAAAAASHFNLVRVTPHAQDLSTPPAKRSRPEQPPAGVRYVAANDQSGLLEAIKQILLAQRPDLIETFDHFCSSWKQDFKVLASSGQPQEPPAAPWPASQLSVVQQRLASEGNLELNQATGRWGVMINKLVPPADSLRPEPPRLEAPRAEPMRLEPLRHEPLRHEPPAFSPIYAQPDPPVATAAFHIDSEPLAAEPASSLSAASGDENLSQAWEVHLQQLPPTGPEPREWRGVMNRNDKRSVQVHLRLLAGQLVPPAAALSITLRSPYEEMLKKTFLGFALLEPARPTEDLATFQDYIDYFENKNRAGVVKLDESSYAYIAPISAVPRAQRWTTAENALFVIFARSNE